MTLTTIISLTAIGLSLAAYATRRRATQSDEQVFGDVPYLHGEFDAVCKLLALWPEHCAEVRNLWEMQPREPETPTEKRKRLIRELAALEGV